jgi:hypothetical protein
VECPDGAGINVPAQAVAVASLCQQADKPLGRQTVPGVGTRTEFIEATSTNSVRRDERAMEPRTHDDHGTRC